MGEPKRESSSQFVAPGFFLLINTFYVIILPLHLPPVPLLPHPKEVQSFSRVGRVIYEIMSKLRDRICLENTRDF